MKIYCGKAIYNNKEITSAINVLRKKPLSLIDGQSVKELEKKITILFGKRYGPPTNFFEIPKAMSGVIPKFFRCNSELLKANRGKQVESQQIDTTRRLYCVQYLLQLSRLQRI